MKLTLMMLVKNEEHRYLRKVLDSASKYVDEIVILDDNSTDNTYRICKSYPKVVKIDKVQGDGFDINESIPRRKLFEMTEKTNPDWIICLDADEILENRFIKEIRSILKGLDKHGIYWMGIEFYHFWHCLTHYRVDKLWKPSVGARIFKYVKGYKYTWKSSRLHCGSLPNNIFTVFPGINSKYRVKHYGYADGIERTKQKYQWYIERDPNSEMCVREHYDSMLDPNPVLEKWVEDI